MLELLLEVIPLAIAAAISPVVLMLALAILAGSRPVAESGAYAVGVVATTIALYGVGLVVIRAQQDGLEPGWLGSDVARIVIGVVLVIAGVVLIVVRPNAARSSAFQERLLGGRRRLRDLAGAGVAVMITNGSSFVILIAILHAVARSGRPLPEEAAALIVATAIVALPALAPFVAAVVGGAGLRALLARVGVFITTYGRQTMGALWILFGCIDIALAWNGR